MTKIQDKILAIVTVITGIFAGLYGGQKNKGARRFGIPGIALIAGLCADGIKWRDFLFLPMIGILSLGYGEHSVLFNALKVDWLVRLVYALMLTYPFWFFGVWRGLVSLVLLVAAFQIHAGSLFHIGTFDVLIEDLLRYGALSGLIAWNVFFPKK